jgi:F-type H+-transporting ATPase subunit a
VAKLGCSSRIVLFAAIVFFALLILGLASGPIGQSKISKVLPTKWLPEKPLSGVKVQELEEGSTPPTILASISYEELVKLGKDKNVDIITIDGENLDSTLKSQKDEDIVNVITTDGKELAVNLKEQPNATLLVSPENNSKIDKLTKDNEITEKKLTQTLRDDGVKVKESSPLAPEPLFGLFGGFSLTNTILAAWLTILVLGLLAYFATRKMKEVPTGLQNLMEALVEGMLSFVQGVAGKENGRRFFLITASIFLFVITNAWLSLLPIFNSITYGGVSILRGANTDINVPLAIALVSFVSVEYWGVASMGFRIYMRKFVRLASLRQGKIVIGVVELFSGGLEAITEVVRILSFTFRLFGNMTAGEILLLVSAFLIPFAFSTIFYGLELFIGFVQALIFAGLTLVFAVTAVASHGQEEGQAEVKH